MNTNVNNKSLDTIKLEKKQRTFKIVQKTIIYTFLIVMAIVVIFPFYWMVISAFKSTYEVSLYPPTLFPEEFVWENFTYVITTSNFFTFLGNTVLVGVISTCCTLCTTVLGAFAFSRLNFKGRDTLFALLLATMMIPGEMFVITNYLTVSNFFGWTDTYYALIVPFVVSVFYIFLLRQTFKQIPNELYYAAKVDGTSDFKYLIKIMIPIAKPTIITILILDLMGAWNSYIWPNLIQNDMNMRLISNWMRDSFTDYLNGVSQTNYQMMASLIVTLPLLIVFIFARKSIMQGVSRSGIKG